MLVFLKILSDVELFIWCRNLFNQMKNENKLYEQLMVYFVFVLENQHLFIFFLRYKSSFHIEKRIQFTYNIPQYGF